MADATRRQVLSAMGAAGLAGLGAVPDRSTAIRDREIPVRAATPTAEPSFADAAEFESVVDAVLTERVGEATPGLTVAIVEGEDLLHAKGYGYADVETERPVHPTRTPFRIGSVSKLVTFTAVMQGVEAGRLALDEDVTTYLDDSAVTVPDTYDDPVTLRHLGTHTAGFASQVPDYAIDPDGVAPVETVLTENRPERVRPPGETAEYSNYGATLAGHVVAGAFDTTFGEYVQSAIFEPLGMTRSTFAQPIPGSHPGEPAAPHARDGDGFARDEPLYVNPRPAGSMSASATDVAAFMSAHLCDGAVDDARILDAATVETMHSRQHVRHPAVTNWRYGFYEHGPVDSSAIAHSGGTSQFVSQVVLVPDRDVGVFVSYDAAPAGNAPAADIDAILREFDLLPEPDVPAPTSDADRAARTERVAGEYSPTFTYDSGPGRVLDHLSRLAVETDGPGRLVSTPPSAGGGDGRTAWVETEPYVFHAVDGSDVLAFDVADGAVEAAHLRSMPQTAYERVGPLDRRLIAGGVVGGSLAGFGLSLLGWGGRGAWRRIRRRRGDPSDEAREHPRVDDAGDAADAEVSE